MCYGGDTRLRRVGDAERAYLAGDTERFRELGGWSGDQYRSKIGRLIAAGSPNAALGIFDTRDYDPTGAADLVYHDPGNVNAQYASTAYEQDRARRQTAERDKYNPFKIAGIPRIAKPALTANKVPTVPKIQIQKVG